MIKATTPDRSHREWIAVAVVSLVGAWLRLQPLGRLGLTHFDEGIYAMTAGWVFQPKGLAAIDPILIPYAPPGYSIVGGLAYLFLGRSDLAMIAVSQCAGVLTIPVVAWLARRTFGPGSGFASATFAAFSGPEIAFSRMALTDVSFLLAWLIALGAGMRFLEKPGPGRAIGMGLTVGLAQQFKYNGWLAGGIVIAAAILGPLVHPEDRRPVRILKTFGWGAVAAVVAWLVVWPWYRFVEGHGGYSDLLRHQRSYLGGVDVWWRHFRTQADQAIALSGGSRLTWASLLFVSSTIAIARPDPWRSVSAGWSPIRRRLVAVGGGLLPIVFLDAPYWLGAMMAPWLLSSPRSAVRVVGVSWLAFAVMTPFYHPYARLWLPLHATNWLMMGWLAAHSFEACGIPSTLPMGRTGAIYLLVVLGLGTILGIESKRHARSQPDLLSASDSLRRACSRIATDLPEDVLGLRVLARPPIPFYLSSRVATFPESGSDQLMRSRDSRLWALVDSAVLRSESGAPTQSSSANLLARFANHWELVKEFPTTLSVPTHLDLDPGSARVNQADRSAPLWLLRPRRPGVPR